MRNPQDHLQHLSDLDLTDEIHNQQEVLDCCVELAQIKSNSSDDDHPHNVSGLYFAALRYEWLVAELLRRTEIKTR